MRHIFNPNTLFSSLKVFRPGSDQNIRNNTKLIRLLPADMTEEAFFGYKRELESRIGQFDIDVESEKILAGKEGTIIISPVSDAFKQHLNHLFFKVEGTCSDPLSSSTPRPHDSFAGLPAGSKDLPTSLDPSVNPANESWGRGV